MLTGEPDAGNLHVRFGGRGGATQCAVPTPITCLNTTFVRLGGSDSTRTEAVMRITGIRSPGPFAFF